MIEVHFITWTAWKIYVHMIVHARINIVNLRTLVRIGRNRHRIVERRPVADVITIRYPGNHKMTSYTYLQLSKTLKVVKIWTRNRFCSMSRRWVEIFSFSSSFSWRASFAELCWSWSDSRWSLLDAAEKWVMFIEHKAINRPVYSGSIFTASQSTKQ